MVAFSNCKINLGLRITEKRSDGFHNLESVFLPVPWYDALEIIESTELSLSASGIPIPGNTENNLCFKAWHLLKKDFPEMPAVSIFLHKTIPAGAGLGGGSSNGAFILRLLNDKFSLGISSDRLAAYALQLGSDCPFFIFNSPALATGRGENIVPVNLDLKNNYLVLVNPSIHVNTGWAFGQITPQATGKNLDEIIKLESQGWEENGLINDFEKPVFSAFPEIASIKDKLLKMGALYASMTGTGSTCYGIFSAEPPVNPNDFPNHYMVKKLKL